jgi:hypothetical protein
VALPAGCSSYSLSFWLHIDSAENTTTAQYDKLTVQVLNSAGTVLVILATYFILDGPPSLCVRCQWRDVSGPGSVAWGHGCRVSGGAAAYRDGPRHVGTG